jgi:blue copper oxidase
MSRNRIAFLFLLFFAAYTGHAQFTVPLPVPDTLPGPIFNLNFAQSQKSLLPGTPTATFAYNGAGFLGPTLILKRGMEVEATVTNQTTDTTTLHWHGLHVPAHADGGPHSPILPFQTWEPHFTCLDRAGTYWYHPHFHGKTGQQTLKGGAGLILVRDAEEGLLPLPRTYGKDDLPLIIQSLEFGPDNQILPLGLRDSIVLINGQTQPYAEVPAQWVRFRMLNASNARNFWVGFEDNRTFSMIGTDGGLLGRPVPVTRIKLAPGERAECMVNFSGQTGQTLHLKSFGSEIPSGTQGGPLGPMPIGTPSMESPLNGTDFQVLQIRVGAPMPGTNTSLPDSLVIQRRLREQDADGERTVVFSSSVPGSPMGPFLVNDSSFSMERIDFKIPINRTEIWTLHNQTVVAHPFHMHGFSFFILDRYGNPVGPEEAGRKDMVQLSPNELVRIAVRFTNFADSTMPYMFHCHILTHEDEGMMGQFVVTQGTTATRSKKKAVPFTVLNPIGERLRILGKTGKPFTIGTPEGRILLEGPIPEEGISTGGWPAGLLFIQDGEGQIQLGLRQP